MELTMDSREFNVNVQHLKLSDNSEPTHDALVALGRAPSVHGSGVRLRFFGLILMMLILSTSYLYNTYTSISLYLSLSLCISLSLYIYIYIHMYT